MNKGFFTFSVFLIFLGFALPLLAQSGNVARKKNLLGNYVYLQNEQRFSEKQFLQKMETNPAAYELMRNARRNRLWSGILGGASGFLIGSQLDFNSNQAGSREVLFAGIALFGASIPFGINYTKRSERAMHLYNAGLARSNSFNRTPALRVGLTPAGFGLGFQF